LRSWKGGPESEFELVDVTNSPVKGVGGLGGDGDGSLVLVGHGGSRGYEGGETGGSEREATFCCSLFDLRISTRMFRLVSRDEVDERGGEIRPRRPEAGADGSVNLSRMGDGDGDRVEICAWRQLGDSITGDPFSETGEVPEVDVAVGEGGRLDFEMEHTREGDKGGGGPVKVGVEGRGEEGRDIGHWSDSGVGTKMVAKKGESKGLARRGRGAQSRRMGGGAENMSV
jgi:hypothetical protein